MRQQVPAFSLGPEELSTAMATSIGSNTYASKGEARRAMAGGGFYVNNVRITDPDAQLPEPLHGRFWIVRAGKKNVRLVEPRE